MQARFISLALVLLTLLFTVSAFADPGAAEKAGRDWLVLVDGGKFTESHDASGKLFRDAVKRDQWAEQLKGVRTPLGKLTARKLKSATPAKALPGAPDGDYVVMTFDASFENKKEAVETLTVSKEADGKYRVVGYFIR
ncbi:MAG: DUF4019 domain-containing protein [Deltaproteobacteria bacterium]|nr:DUF4019 domain-containing protein [Deltaproteobacteria bacterium]